MSILIFILKLVVIGFLWMAPLLFIIPVFNKLDKLTDNPKFSKTVKEFFHTLIFFPVTIVAATISYYLSQLVGYYWGQFFSDFGRIILIFAGMGILIGIGKVIIMIPELIYERKHPDRSFWIDLVEHPLVQKYLPKIIGNAIGITFIYFIFKDILIEWLEKIVFWLSN